MKAGSVALCLLTWNEIQGCTHDIPQLDQTQFEQIFCIDGGSTDGTVAFLNDNGIPVHQQEKKGLNQACKEAVNRCECDAIVFFHPKGSVSIEDTYRFRAFFDKGYDLVVASRMIKGGHNEEDRYFIRPRKWFVLFLGYIAAIFFRREGYYIRDVLHGFRGVRKDAFLRMDISDCDPSIDIEMVSRSYKLHMSRIEFPTNETERVGGGTHFKAIPTGKKLIKYIVWEVGRK